MKSLAFSIILLPSVAIADCKLRIGLDRIDSLEKQVEYLSCMNDEKSLLIEEVMNQVYMLALQAAAYKMRFLAIEKALKENEK